MDLTPATRLQRLPLMRHAWVPMTALVLVLLGIGTRTPYAISCTELAYVAVVILVAAFGGLMLGLICAALAMFILPLHLAWPGPRIIFDALHLPGALEFAAVLLATALLVGLFKRRCDVSLALAQAATVEQARLQAATDAKRRLHEAVRERETILNNVTAGIAFLKERRYVWVNRAMCEITGLTKDELLESTTERLFACREEWERVGREAYGTLARGERFEIEHQTIRNDGERRWVHAKGSPIDGIDPLEGSIWVIDDVTERKHAEAAIRESEGRLRAFFRLAGVGLAYAQPETGRWLAVNEKLCEITGYSASELLSMTALEVTHPEDREEDRERFGAMVRGEQSGYETEKRYLRKDGNAVWVQVSTTLIRDAHGRPVHSAGAAVDITGRKRAEAALRDSEELHRAFFDLAAVGFAQADPVSGRWVEVNQKMCEITGYTAEELTTKLTFREITHPDDLARDEYAFEQLTRGEIPVYRTEKRYLRKDGDFAWVHIEVVLMRDHASRPWRTANVVLDVTERKALDAALRASEQRGLRDALRQRDVLIREVHHRIKNHLQGVVGLLMQNAYERPDMAPLVRRASAQVQTVALVHGLQARTAVNTVELCELVPAIASNVESLARVRIVVEIEAMRCAIRAAESEPVAVALIINELLFNAAKHACSKQGVRVDVGPEGQGMTIAIRNRAELPAGFDFAAGSGLGTGLELVHALIPTTGASLTIAQEGAEVATRLTLAPPLIET